VLTQRRAETNQSWLAWLRQMPEAAKPVAMLGLIERFANRPPELSVGEQCGHRPTCRWKGRCESDWEAADHLTLDANITRHQIRRLWEAGISAVRALAAPPAGSTISGIQPDTLDRLLFAIMFSYSAAFLSESDHRRFPQGIQSTVTHFRERLSSSHANQRVCGVYEGALL